MLRILVLMCMIILPMSLPVRAQQQTPSYSAGVLRLTVADVDGPFDTLIWYPAAAAETPWRAGPFTVSASLNAAMARDMKFPVVLLSHGSGGSPMAHRDLAASLARAGFVVIVPTHLGDAAGHPRMAEQARILMARPRQALEALDAALADPRFSHHVDPRRLGMIGYSAGGYTALVLAGARPDFALAQSYCAGEGRGDVGSCGPAGHDRPDALEQLQKWQPNSEPRLKALVLMDPLSMLFGKAGLASVSIPIELFRPRDDSYLNAEHNALALARGLPTPPLQIVVPGRHFVFIDPCPQSLMAEAATLCRDDPEVDRIAIHRDLQDDIAAFLRRQL